MPHDEPQDESQDESLFRQEALDHHLQSRGEGDVLRIAPGWTRWTYWILVGMIVVGILYMTFGKIDEYAAGPAVIEVVNSSDVSCVAPGTVAEVLVAPGDRVEEGQVLVRLHDDVERTDLERLQIEYEAQLVRLLRDRTDIAAQQSMVNLRSQLQMAQARAEERTLRSPQAGVITDVRVREGQGLMTGQSVVGLVSGEPRLEVLAMLPGHFRPLLEEGMEMRLSLTGYSYAYQELTITRIAEEVVGPGVARGYLRPKMAEAIAITGPVVLVWGEIPVSTFFADGKEHPYYDGQMALAEARVQSESILVALVPGLEALFEKLNG